MTKRKHKIKDFALIKCAPKDGHQSVGFEFPLLGEENQMFNQRNFLQQQGFEVRWAGKYPAVKTQTEFHAAVKLIYEHQVDGWWLYKDILIQLGLLDDEAEFMRSLNGFIVQERAKLSRFL